MTDPGLAVVGEMVPGGTVVGTVDGTADVDGPVGGTVVETPVGPMTPSGATDPPGTAGVGSNDTQTPPR